MKPEYCYRLLAAPLLYKCVYSTIIRYKYVRYKFFTSAGTVHSNTVMCLSQFHFTLFIAPL